MKAAAFEFIRAGSVDDAVRLLAENGASARLVAGGQSLGPLLNLRLTRPSLLIDITGVPDLTRIEASDDAVTVGACVTTANIEDGRLPGPGLDVMARVAAHIAYRAVRNRGTLGGSLCHADPAADWVSLLCALRAECLIVGSGGRRRLPADQFVVAPYETALGPDEMLEAIRIPRLSSRGGCGYHKICRKQGEFPLAVAAVVDDRARGCLRAVIGSPRRRPLVVEDARTLWRQDGALDEAAASRVLDDGAIIDRAARRQTLTALCRARAESEDA
jgi:carbon-monoxide dehydrogenase medium subunit